MVRKYLIVKAKEHWWGHWYSHLAGRWSEHGGCGFSLGSACGSVGDWQ